MPEKRTFQIFGCYADSPKWEPLGPWVLDDCPRIGEMIVADVDDFAHAFRVLGVHHPEGGGRVDAADVFVVHAGPVMKEMDRLFREAKPTAFPRAPDRTNHLLVAPGYRAAPGDEPDL
jgi:hypothetical protein